MNLSTLYKIYLLYCDQTWTLLSRIIWFLSFLQPFISVLFQYFYKPCFFFNICCPFMRYICWKHSYRRLIVESYKPNIFYATASTQFRSWPRSRPVKTDGLFAGISQRNGPPLGPPRGSKTTLIFLEHLHRLSRPACGGIIEDRRSDKFDTVAYFQPKKAAIMGNL